MFSVPWNEIWQFLQQIFWFLWQNFLLVNKKMFCSLNLMVSKSHYHKTKDSKTSKAKPNRTLVALFSTPLWIIWLLLCTIKHQLHNVLYEYTLHHYSEVWRLNNILALHAMFYEEKHYRMVQNSKFLWKFWIFSFAWCFNVLSNGTKCKIFG